MEIPYTVEIRPDTGLSNGKLGVWLFLASEVMLFGALFSSYILLRVGSTEWPHGFEELNVPMAAFNTVVLITSSVTMVMAWASLKMKNFGKFRMHLGLTIGLALLHSVVGGGTLRPYVGALVVICAALTAISGGQYVVLGLRALRPSGPVAR